MTCSLEKQYVQIPECRKVLKPVIKYKTVLETSYFPLLVWNSTLGCDVQQWFPKSTSKEVQYIDYETVTEIFYEKITKSEYDRRANQRTEEYDRKLQRDKEIKAETLKRVEYEIRESERIKKESEKIRKNEEYLSIYISIYGDNLYNSTSKLVRDFIRAHPFILFPKVNEQSRIKKWDSTWSWNSGLPFNHKVEYVLNKYLNITRCSNRHHVNKCREIVQQLREYCNWINNDTMTYGTLEFISLNSYFYQISEKSIDFESDQQNFALNIYVYLNWAYQSYMDKITNFDGEFTQLIMYIIQKIESVYPDIRNRVQTIQSMIQQEIRSLRDKDCNELSLSAFIAQAGPKGWFDLERFPNTKKFINSRIDTNLWLYPSVRQNICFMLGKDGMKLFTSTSEYKRKFPEKNSELEEAYYLFSILNDIRDDLQLNFKTRLHERSLDDRNLFSRIQFAILFLVGQFPEIQDKIKSTGPSLASKISKMNNDRYATSLYLINVSVFCMEYFKTAPFFSPKVSSKFVQGLHQTIREKGFNLCSASEEIKSIQSRIREFTNKHKAEKNKEHIMRLLNQFNLLNNELEISLKEEEEKYPT